MRQLHFRWVALVNVVGCTGATYFVIPKNSPRMPQVVQKNSAEPLSDNAQTFTLASEVASYHCVDTDAPPSNSVTEAAIVRDPAPGDNHVQPDEAALLHLKCSVHHRCHNSVKKTLELAPSLSSGALKPCTFDAGARRCSRCSVALPPRRLETDASFSQHHFGSGEQ